MAQPNIPVNVPQGIQQFVPTDNQPQFFKWIENPDNPVGKSKLSKDSRNMAKALLNPTSWVPGVNLDGTPAFNEYVAKHRGFKDLVSRGHLIKVPAQPQEIQEFQQSQKPFGERFSEGISPLLEKLKQPFKETPSSFEQVPILRPDQIEYQKSLIPYAQRLQQQLEQSQQQGLMPPGLSNILMALSGPASQALFGQANQFPVYGQGGGGQEVLGSLLGGLLAPAAQQAAPYMGNFYRNVAPQGFQDAAANLTGRLSNLFRA